MQKAAKQIQDCPQLGIDIFLRGAPEPMQIEDKPVYFLPIQDLFSALAAPLRRRKPDSYTIAPMRLYSMEESVERMRHLLGVMPSWSVLRNFMPEVQGEGPILEQRSAIASTFAATLELVKNGELELRQDGTFAPIYIRRRESTPEATTSEE
jgi:segregation and condensation protein A